MLVPVGDEIKYPEKWALVDCIPNVPLIYWVSTWGRLHNCITKNYLPKKYDRINDNEYVTVTLACGHRHDNISIDLHRLVMMQFCPHPLQNILEIDHLDGIRYHNWIWNLEWVTHEENIKRAVLKGSFNKGETRKSSKLSNAQAEQICQLIDQGYTSKQVSQILNLDSINVEKIYFNIKRGHSWKSISEKYSFSKKWTNQEGSTTSTLST